jgi:PAS domain S-box-containing protein
LAGRDFHPRGCFGDFVDSFDPQRIVSPPQASPGALISLRVSLTSHLEHARESALLLTVGTVSLLGLCFWLALFLLRKNDEKNRALAEQSTYLDSVLGASKTLGIAATDEEGRVRYFNEAAATIFGSRMQDVLGRSIESIHEKWGIPQDRLSTIVERVLEQGSLQMTVRPSQAHGKQHVHVSLTHLAALGGRAFVFIAEDISLKLQEEEERQQMEAKLQQAQKMEALGRMAGGVAHDLNNVLVGVTGNAELALMDCAGNCPQRESLEQIQEAGRQAAAIVGELLTVSKGAARAHKPTSLHNVIHEVLASTRVAHVRGKKPGVHIELALDATREEINCSRSHVRASLLSLVINAIDAHTKNGTVVIETENREIAPAFAKQHDLDAQQHLLVRVRDQGPLISPSDLEKIFEPFFCKKQLSRSNTGLGLAVVWSTMRDHHGCVLARSSEKQTTFELFFPGCQPTTQPSLQQKLGDLPRGNGEQILVVDDEPTLRLVGDRMLSKLGYRVLLAENGEKALELLQQNKVDLIVLDMVMEPGINGAVTYQRALEINPEQRAIIASGYAATAEVETTLELGAHGFLEKPYTMRQLAQIVRDALDA